jgi:glycosyltransferase involved in cell wall biosynthesis
MIAGTGTLEGEMNRRIDGSNLSGHVELLGEIPLEKLNDYYNACDALVSGSPYEGFCLPAIEALACGKPLIVRRRGAMIEHVLDSGCGKVFDDSSETFKDAADKALKLKSAYLQKRAKSYLVPFTWKNAAYQYSKIYRGLLAKRMG